MMGGSDNFWLTDIVDVVAIFTLQRQSCFTYSYLYGHAHTLFVHSKCKGFSNEPNPASFCLFSFFSHDKYSTNLTLSDTSIDEVLGTRTRDGRMVGSEESIELWRHPINKAAFTLRKYLSYFWRIPTIRSYKTYQPFGVTKL